VPADARFGDHICVILGCEVPLLLRPSASHNGQYQLVGGYYVHGLMYGEGLLGPIPSLWERSSILVDNVVHRTWKRAQEGENS